ncbi:hypothetical protein F3Y22_tig00110704pilonHSYRG00026 [Hibiscus syriacus]|uniref:Uncharacterized protein n=1 Tax=Hibiscus syriacus TaxID=106335 RepID=A0A6A2ZW01_HIBSY|nr:hypothetical protein F3Y22_tig00110704pilonHSYRG00026 [Hibiscus syriacus]
MGDDHVWILCGKDMCRENKNDEKASFKFYIKHGHEYKNTKENIKVKKCGVHVFYVDGESYTSNEETDYHSATDTSFSYSTDEEGTYDLKDRNTLIWGGRCALRGKTKEGRVPADNNIGRSIRYTVASLLKLTPPAFDKFMNDSLLDQLLLLVIPHQDSTRVSQEVEHGCTDPLTVTEDGYRIEKNHN